jgi:hypothetical protein
VAEGECFSNCKCPLHVPTCLIINIYHDINFYFYVFIT